MTTVIASQGVNTVLCVMLYRSENVNRGVNAGKLGK